MSNVKTGTLKKGVKKGKKKKGVTISKMSNVWHWLGDQVVNNEETGIRRLGKC